MSSLWVRAALLRYRGSTNLHHTQQATLTATAVTAMVALAILKVASVQPRRATQVQETAVRVETGSGTQL